MSISMKLDIYCISLQYAALGSETEGQSIEQGWWQ